MKLSRILCIAKNVQHKLASNIETVIKNVGPISVHNFMRDVLTDKNQGYYMTNKVFGKEGDFITSPDISQMFGELWGIWIVYEWINQGSPSEFQIVEFGPGRGGLMHDALRAIGHFPSALSALKSINLIEISPELQKVQEKRISDVVSKFNIDVSLNWWDSIDHVQNGMCTAYLAHEFFDVLPIHKFQKNKMGKWTEVLVDIVNQSEQLDNQFHLIMSGKETPALLAFREILEKEEELDHMEISPEALKIIDKIGERLIQDKGFVLIADYGHYGNKGDTFRGFKSHEIVDPLKHTGECDITADVNFKLIGDHFKNRFTDNVNVFGPLNQTTFLRNMGIDVRLKVLLDNCKSEEQQRHLVSGYQMIMNTQGMGDRFKFISVLPTIHKYPTGYIPAGFVELS